MPAQGADAGVLMDALGHRFRDAALLESALTHPSLAGGRQPRGTAAYERLEFLGDRVLGLVIAAWLYEMHPDLSEGELAKRHSGLVNRDIVARVAAALHLGDYLKLAKSERVDGRVNANILSDACEALIGALYLDGGLAPAEAFIRRLWQPLLREGEHERVDAKTALQEWAQARGLPLPVYALLNSAGPAHAPRFVVEVRVKGLEPVSAEGTSKRAAEKAAAVLMLERISGG